MKTGKAINRSIALLLLAGIVLCILSGCAGGGQKDLTAETLCFAEGSVPFEHIQNEDPEKGVAEFIELLKKDGYRDSEGQYHVYNVGNTKEWWNITSPYVLKNSDDIGLFMNDGYDCFLQVGDTVYRPFAVFGGWVKALALCDCDNDGTKEVVAYHSYGSGVSYLGITVFDTKTGIGKECISVNTLKPDAGLEYRFDGTAVYANGEDIRKLYKR